MSSYDDMTDSTVVRRHVPEAVRAIRVDSPEALGQVLRAARRRRGLTQQELAETLGASRDWVNRVERGRAPRA